MISDESRVVRKCVCSIQERAAGGAGEGEAVTCVDNSRVVTVTLLTCTTPLQITLAMHSTSTGRS